MGQVEIRKLLRDRWFRLLAISVCCWVSNPVIAQEYPSRPVTLLVGFAPGSSTDSIGRLTAQFLSEKFKVPILVDNKPGGSTVISVQALMKSARDGYTLKLGVASTLVQNPGVQKNLPYDPAVDFTAVVGVARMSGVLAVRNQLPVSSVRELVAYLKKNPGKVTYGSSGIGAAGHLNGEYFLYRTGTEMIHVPYKGANLVTTDLVAERLDLAITTGAASLPFVRAGKIRALAVTTTARLRAAPDIPTLAEAGFPGMEALDPFTFYGIVGPAGLAATPVAKVNQAINEILKNADFVTKLGNLDFDPNAPNTPAEFSRFLASQLAVWRDLGSRLQIETQ